MYKRKGTHPCSEADCHVLATSERCFVRNGLILKIHLCVEHGAVWAKHFEHRVSWPEQLVLAGTV